MKGTIRKRGSSWEYQILVGTDELTGKKKFKSKGGFSTKKQAEAACAEAIMNVETGKVVMSKEMTFGQFARYWLDTKQGTIENNTYNGYKYKIQHYMFPAFEKIRLSQINELMIRKWAKWLMDKLSSGHAVDNFKMMRQLLSKAVKKQLIARNPFDDIETPKFSRKKMQVWTPEQFNLFLEHTTHSIYHCVYYLALATGMRQSELLGLQWDSVNFENNTISVRSSLELYSKTIKDRVKRKSSIRSIVVNDTVMQYLKRHRHEQNKRKILLGPAWPDNNLVCSTEIGTPITARNVLRFMYIVQERLNLPKITFHELRHTHATTLLSEGLDPTIIQQRLGHKSIDITLDIYSHVTPKMQKEAANVMDRILRF